MMYSQWRPDKGGYLYFETDERRGLGDDLPVPKLPAGTAIGVASTDIGRPPGAGLRPAGSGPVARGSILALSRDGLSGPFESLSYLPWWVTVGALSIGAFAILWEIRRTAR